MLTVKFAKEDVLYSQLNAVYLGKWELFSGLTVGIYRNRGSLKSKPVLNVDLESNSNIIPLPTPAACLVFFIYAS